MLAIFKICLAASIVSRILLSGSSPSGEDVLGGDRELYESFLPNSAL